MSSTTKMARASSEGGARRLLAGRRISPRDVAVVAGYGFLLWTLVIVLFLPNGWVPFWTASFATALLSLDRRLGPVPAAMLMMLAIPVGRGAEVGLPELPGTDIPIRMHDAISLIGVAGTLPAVIRRLSRPRSIPWESAAPVAAFVAIGIVALAVGVAGDQAMRDVIRDARWWAFYAVGLAALLAAVPRQNVIRATVIGLTLYSVVILIGLVMPVFYGGLKWYAYSYDPRLRLHYGQAIFLLVAVAYTVNRATRRPGWSLLALVGLFGAAVAVTLTRTLLAAVVGVTVLVAIAAAYEAARRVPAPLMAKAWTVTRRAAPALLALVIGLAAGFRTYDVGVQVWRPLGAAESQGGRGSIPDEPPDGRPIIDSANRILEDTASTGVAAQVGGRLASYAYAFTDTARSPLIGHGMGKLARVPWAWGGFRAQTAGSQPGVDNAYLTVGLKAGAVGIAAFAAMMLWPIRLAWGNRRLRTWFVPAWLTILGLTLLQSFAVSGYAPFALSILLVVPALGYRRRRRGPPVS